MKKSIIGLVVAMSVVMLLGWSYINQENKIILTDPSHTEFQEDNFHFNNYRTEKSLHDALEILFPIGTPKKTVDEVLGKFSEIKKRNLRHPKFKDKNEYSYEYNNTYKKILVRIISSIVPAPGPPDSWPTHYVVIEYDGDNRLVKIKVLNVYF
ncbi:MAG: hypothetical protein ACRBDL_06735 [Alphaproteobacteria bacterium]